MSPNESDVTSKFTTRVERIDNRYIIEVPEQEFKYGTLLEGDVCRVSIEVVDSDHDRDDAESYVDSSQAPVSVGDQRTVEIESLGDEGDGIARLDRGYVVIVPDTEPGDVVGIELVKVTQNVGFAEVIGHDEDSNEVF